MTLKFYLHAATTSDTGTLPAAGTSVSASTPTVIASGGDTNRSMDGTIGVSQASIVLNTNAVSTAQSGLIGRWCSAPIAAQTLSAQNLHVRAAFAESNANSDFFPAPSVVVWRPAGGSVVGRLYDLASTFLEAGTTETDSDEDLGTSTAVTAQEGDILVVEMWRISGTQAMSTSYTNTVFYDGTTEGSATTNAAYLLFANDVAMSTGAAAQVPYVNYMPSLLAQ